MNNFVINTQLELIAINKLIISFQQMHYIVLVFSVPTYVSALPVSSSGVSSRVHNWNKFQIHTL